MSVASISALSRFLTWLKGMPDWFRAAFLGGMLVLATILVVGWGRPAVAEDVDKRLGACEQKQDSQQSQLDRIEGKLDRLLLRLIPGGK